VIFVCVCIGASCGCQKVTQPKSNVAIDEEPVPYESREFSYDYSNVTDETVWVNSVRVLNKLVNMHRVWANGDGAGISFRRNDCTPAALLNTKADFEWWRMDDPFDSKKASSRPKDVNKVFECSSLFPWFDVEADKWRCVFTLQNDKTWVGRFEGVVLKPVGAKSEILKRSQLKGDNHWIQFQFCNLTDKEICFPMGEGKLVHANGVTQLHIPNVPADKMFHGFSANSHEGSIYRPLPSDRVELAWSGVGGPAPAQPVEFPRQTIDLPNFDPEVDYWFCYFTLHPNGEWTSVFEGTRPEK